MKKSSLSVLFSLLSVIAFAQFPVSPNARDENDRATGHWTILYDSVWHEVQDPDSASYYRLILFEKGKPVGKVRDFYKSGHRQWDGYLLSVKPDVSDGETKTYYQNGKVKSVAYYQNGTVNGIAHEYASNGNITLSANYVNGVSEGKYSVYHENGTPYYETQMKGGKMSGDMIIYHDNGVVSARGKMVDGNKEGIWEHYHATGKLKSRAGHIGGVLNGLYDVYDENGVLQESSPSKDGYSDGPYKIFYPSGIIKEEGTFVAPKGKNGPKREYYENGSLKSEGNMLDDNYEGNYTSWYANKNVESTGSYKKGRSSGLWKFYYENSQIKSAGELYSTDSLTGKWIFYYEDGRVKSEEMYVKNLLDGQKKSHWEDGTIEIMNYVRGSIEGAAFKYYADGKLKEEYNYEHGVLNGKVNTYFQNGSLIVQTTFVNGQLSGPYTVYFDDGSVSIRTAHRDGKYHGEYISHHKNGKIHEKGFYDTGRKIISWEQFYSNGKPTQKKKYKNNKYTWVAWYSNGERESEGQGISKDFNDVQNGLQKAYFQNGQLANKGYTTDGKAHGKFEFYDSLTGKKSTEGNYAHGKYHGAWKFFDKNGKQKSVKYYVNGFEETAIHIHDSVNILLEKREFKLALTHIDWYKRVLERDVPKHNIKWALPHRWLGDIFYELGDKQKALLHFIDFRDAVVRLEGDTTANYNIALNRMAITYSDLHDYQKSFEINNGLLNSVAQDGDAYAVYLFNRSIDLYRLDRKQEGIKYLEAELMRRTDKFGESAKETITMLQWIASYAYLYTLDYLAAIEYNKKLLSLVGENDEHYAVSMRAISDCYFYLDKTDESIRWMTDVIDLQKKLKTDRYQQYSNDVASLATRYGYQKKNLEGVTVITAGLNTLISYGKIRSYEAAVLLNEGSSLLAGDNYDNSYAISAAEGAKGILDELGITEDVLYGKVLMSLATSHNQDGSLRSKAEKYYIMAATFDAKKYGLNSTKYNNDLSALASYYTNVFNFTKADSVLSVLEESVLKNFGNGHYLYAAYHSRAGEKAVLQYHYSEAISHYTIVKDYYEKNVSTQAASYSTALQNLSDAHSVQGNLVECDRLRREALAMYDKYLSRKSVDYVNIQVSLAENLEKQLNFQEAKSLYQQAIKSYKELVGAAYFKYRYAIFKLAKLDLVMKEYKAAEEGTTLAARLSVEHAPRGEEYYFEFLQQMAAIKTAQMKYDDADQIYQKARAAGLPYRQTAGYFLFLQSYAKFYTGLNRYSAAEELLIEALGLARNLVGEDHWFFATVAIDLSKVYRNMGKLAEAEEMIQKAMVNALNNKSEDPSSYIAVVRTLAQNFRNMGRYEEAEKLHKKIIEFVKSTEGKSNWYATELLDAGRLYLDWSKYDSVNKINEEALLILRENLAPDNENILNSYNQLGIAALRTNQVDAAEEYFRKDLETRLASGKITTDACAVAYHNLSTVLIQKERYEEAEAGFKKAMSIRKENNIQANLAIEASSTDDMALLYQQWGKSELAETYWKQTLEKLHNYIRTNFPFMSDYEKSKFWERYKSDFEYFNSFAVARQEKNPLILGEMYNYRLATKGILLSASNKVRKRIYASRDSKLIKQYHQWTETREQIAREYARASSEEKTSAIDSLEQIVNTLEKDLSLSAFETKDKEEVIINWKSIQQRLSPTEAAIEIIRYRHYGKQLTDSIVYAALIVTSETKSAPKLVIFPNGKFLEGKAYKYYRNTIAAQMRDDLSFRNFWAPIAPFVKGKRTLYVSLDGVFNQVNFKTLSEREGQYLMDEKDFVLVSNTRDVVSIKSRKKLKLLQNATLIGNPKFYLQLKDSSGRTREANINNNSVAPLPGTGVEVKSISQQLTSHGWKVNSLTSFEANEHNVKQLLSSRVIHFATHGFFQEFNTYTWATADPMLRSGILLSGATNFLASKLDSAGENGILTAYEAAGLSLDGTEMVVLSACETARGDIQQGEGVYGLQRAFISAGAESLVMSLWKVDDQATQKLMSVFYENLMKGLDKSEALNQAQQTIKGEYPHPYYWGAFVMIKG